LAVLGRFSDKTPDGDGSQHNWISDAGLEYRGRGRSWTLAESSASHAVYADQQANGLAYRMTYRLREQPAGVDVAFEVVNGSATTMALPFCVFPLNGLHQDVGANDSYYSAIAWHRAGAMQTASLPSAPGETPVVAAGDLDYVALKTRFFTGIFVPQGARISGAAPAVAAPVVTEGPVGPGGGAPNPTSSDSDSIGGAWLRVGAFGYTQDAGGRNPRHHAMLFVRFQPTAERREWPLAPGQRLEARWQILVSGMTKSDIAQLTEAQQRLEFTDSWHKFFRILSNFLTSILNGIAWVVQSYGIAIIILTLLVKAALHRTMYKQQLSMRKMAKLAPEMKRIQEQYRDNKQMAAAKTMELYKKHGANPLAGCLPVLVQMPIFIALYQTFSHSADMRGEGFLWAVDLTLPDQLLPLFSLFGWHLTLNPLPIIYILVSLWSSYHMVAANTTPMSEQQEQMMKMMRWMPVIFGIFFYNMPTGLVLYFTCSALLGALEMKWIRYRLSQLD
jgi:YidC/Oxa1 family membrane protein insertase